jgi:hypothetical protein
MDEEYLHSWLKIGLTLHEGVAAYRGEEEAGVLELDLGRETQTVGPVRMRHQALQRGDQLSIHDTMGLRANHL